MQTRTKALQDIFHCVKVLETLQGIYPAADFCVDFISDVLHRAKIGLLVEKVFGVHGLLFGGVRYDFEDFREQQTGGTSIPISKIIHQEIPDSDTIIASHQDVTLGHHATAAPEQKELWESDFAFESSYHLDDELVQDTSLPSEDWFEIFSNFEDFQDPFASIY